MTTLTTTPLAAFSAAARRVLQAAYEGRHDATRAIEEYTDPAQYPPEVSELAETMSFTLVKLEAREMALEEAVVKLEDKNRQLEEVLEQRDQFGLIFILFTIFIAVYTFVSSYLYSSGAYSAEELSRLKPVSAAIFAVLAVPLAAAIILRSGLPLTRFGLNTRNLGRSLWESALVTIVMCALFAGVRIYLASRTTLFAGRAFFDFSSLDAFFWIYLVIAPAQEFLGRGVLQGSIQRLLVGRWATLWSVVLASLLFGVTHTHYSFALSCLSLLGGLLWGWLYVRHENVIGISLSHIIVGEFLMMIGFWQFLQ